MALRIFAGCPSLGHLSWARKKGDKERMVWGETGARSCLKKHPDPQQKENQIGPLTHDLAILPQS